MSINLRLSSSSNGLRNTIVDDIKVTYGAAGDGTTNDAQKFVDFQTARTGQTLPVTLIEPAGTYNLGSSTTAQFFMKGIPNARLVGAGQGTTILSYSGTSPVRFGGKGLFFDNLHSALIQTVSSGLSSVTLVDANQATLATVGRWVLVAGFDLMGQGDPANNHFFNYAKLVSKAGGVLGLDRPLTHDYKSTWPRYNDGANYATGGGMDQAGPATIYFLDASFDCSVEVRDQTITQGNNQTYAEGTSITYRNVTFTGTAGAIPSQNVSWLADTCIYSSASASIEVDKFVKDCEFRSVTAHKIHVQSSSVDLMRLTRSTLDQLAGTPKATIISGGTITTLQVGTASFGRADSMTIGLDQFGVGAVIGSIANAAFTDDGPGHTGFATEYSMSGGVISIANSKFTTAGGATDVKAPRWAVPGTNLCFLGTGGVIAICQTGDVTQDGTNTYVATSLLGGFPTGTTNVSPHPCPLWVCTGATGCADIVDLSQAGAQNRPLYEYSKRSYVGSSTDATGNNILLTATAGEKPKLWGTIVSIKINVLTAYSGGGALTFKLSQFDNWTVRKTDGTTYSLAITVNTKITGERVITTSAPTGSQTGDTLPTLNSGDWMMGVSNSGPILSADVSASNLGPIFTVEIITSQGVV